MHRFLLARLPLSRSLLLPIPVIQTVVGSDASVSPPAKLSALSTPEQVARRGAVARGGLSRRLRSRHHRCLSVGAISTPEPVPMEGEGIEHEKSQDILKKDQHPLSRYVQVTDDQSMVVFVCVSVDVWDLTMNNCEYICDAVPPFFYVFRDDMSASYGEGYSTRSGDDGFGQVYGKSGKAVRERKLAREAEEEDDVVLVDPKNFDRTQGSPVAQKEAARHSDPGNAFEDEAAALRRKDAEIYRRRVSGEAI